jgi:hypothetical protein
MMVPIIRVRDKHSGQEHIVGFDRHDSLIKGDDCSLMYRNMQNGDGSDDGYEFVFDEDEFGAFIVGGKDALKFYNGSSFSNKYITTQFQSNNTTLESVEFKTMTVSFTMGVYWFTIEEYRKILQ